MQKLSIHQAINLKTWAGGSGMFALKFSKAFRKRLLTENFGSSIMLDQPSNFKRS